MLAPGEALLLDKGDDRPVGADEAGRRVMVIGAAKAQHIAHSNVPEFGWNGSARDACQPCFYPALIRSGGPDLPNPTPTRPFGERGTSDNLSRRAIPCLRKLI